MKREPFVSVIIPTWNRAGFLPEAIDSVRAQNYDNLEIIVVDDGSTDETAQLLPRYGDRIRPVRQENRGPAAARNHGLSRARGEMIAFLDSDDLWPQSSLASRLDAFDDAPATHIALGQTQVTGMRRDADGSPRYEAVTDPAFATLFGAALCRRETFEIVGLLDESLRTGEDVDWFVRAREVDVVTTLVPAVTHQVRRHDDNMTLEDEPRSRGLLLAIKRSLDRRRAAGGTRIAELHRWNTERILGPSSSRSKGDGR